MEIQILKVQIKSTRKMTTTQSFSEKTTETGGLGPQHLRDAAQDDEDARTNTKVRDGAKNQAELSSKPPVQNEESRNQSITKICRRRTEKGQWAENKNTRPVHQAIGETQLVARKTACR